jgi:hypothetical protein
MNRIVPARRPGTHASRLLVAALLVPGAAAAAQLIVNNVPIGKVDLTVAGIEGITFEKCSSVKIEAGGDVRIDCPGYDLQSAAPAAQAASTTATPAPAAVPGRVTKRFWVVTEQSQKGMTQYDIDLYVNSKWVKRFKNDDESVVLEITKHLLPGKNRLLFAATKNVGESRRSTSPAAFYRIVVGEGDVGGQSVLIDNPLVEIRRTAAETDNLTEEREVLGR